MKNRLTAIGSGIALLVCIVSLVVADACVQSILSDISLLRMSAEIGNDGSDIEMEVQEVKRQAQGLRQEVALLESRQPLDIDAFKTLASDNRLQLRRLSRKSGDSRGGADHEYATELSGTIGAVVRMLHEVDSRYVAQVSRLQITPADDTGEKVNLRMWLSLPD